MSGLVRGNPTLPLAEWPALDRAAWQAALQPADLFAPGGAALGWADTTRLMVVQGYGRWLSWLQAQGQLDPAVPPAERLTSERLATYLAELCATVASFTVASRIQQLGNAMRALVPDQDWRWIQRAADRIRSKAVSVRNKRAHLQSPDQLQNLGIQLMAWAESTLDVQPAECAVAYRDGLLIAFLAHRPLRLKNLAAIVCGQHLLYRGSAWGVSFPASEMKNKQALDVPFPTELLPHLQRWLTFYHPILAGRGEQGRSAPTRALWVSWHGTQMGSDAIWHQVKLRTQQAFGKAINPHLFRDCAATAIATYAPEHVTIIQAILGHSSGAVAETHYNQAGTIEAGRRHADVIAELRDEAREAEKEEAAKPAGRRRR